MMESFAKQRQNVHPRDLSGPRVYSTDLVSRPNDPSIVNEVARSLKIKLVTKGTVVLNGRYLLSPLGVALMERHPDLMSGGGIIPAFRTDHGSLREQSDRFASALAASGMAGARMEDHLSKLEKVIDKVMPWDLGDVGDRLRSNVMEGLRSSDTLVSRRLSETGMPEVDRLRMADEIGQLDMSQNDSLRSYAEAKGAPIGDILGTYVTTWYHRVGVEVVECETGTDLFPLSEMKADDLLLAMRDARRPMLDDAAVFRDQFVAYALDAIQAMVATNEMIDNVSFQRAHELGGALGATEFQSRYDEIVRSYVATAELREGDILEGFDTDSIVGHADALGRLFETNIRSELLAYRTKGWEVARGDLVRSGADILKDMGNAALPVVSNITAVIDGFVHAGEGLDAANRLWDMRSVGQQMLEARKQRETDMRDMIEKHRMSGPRKAALLDGMALLTDLYGRAVSRA